MTEFKHVSKAYSKALPFWVKWRDATKGEDAVKEKGEVYLPRGEFQTPEEYKVYLKGASYYNATGKAVDALTSLQFRKEISLSLGRLTSLEQRSCRDLSLMEIMQECSKEVWTVGRVGLLAEINDQGEPQLYYYEAESIVNWRFVGESLQFVILKECYEELSKDSSWVLESKVQYRLLLLENGAYRQLVFRDNGKEWLVIPELTETPTRAGGESLDFIPFVFINFETEGGEIGKSPITDLANLNLKHYVGTADVENILHLACNPFLLVQGLPREERPKKFPSNSATVLYLETDGKASYVVCPSDSVKPRQEDLRTKEDQMARLGSNFLRGQKKEAETAESMRLQQSGETGTMLMVSFVLSKGFTKAIRFLARWLGYDESEISVNLPKDFFDSPVDFTHAEYLLKLYQGGLIDMITLFEALTNIQVLKPELLKTIGEKQNGIKEKTNLSTGSDNSSAI